MESEIAPVTKHLATKPYKVGSFTLPLPEPTANTRTYLWRNIHF